jgi:hypothetical protein
VHGRRRPLAARGTIGPGAHIAPNFPLGYRFIEPRRLEYDTATLRLQGPTKLTFLDLPSRRSIVIAMDVGVVAPAPAPFSAELTPSPARHAGGPADFGERAQLQCAHPRLRFLCRMAGEPTPHDAAVRGQV